MLLIIPLNELATRHIKHVINTGSVNYINNIWPYFYAILWHYTISIFVTRCTYDALVEQERSWVAVKSILN
jgi:hypothetical protein